MDSLPADQDLQIVIGLELRLLEPQVRAAPGDVEALLHPDFAEFGASGRRWNRADMIAALAAEQPGAEEPSITATEISGTRLAGDVIHLTYTSQRGGRRAHRSSIWLRTDEGWRVYFHQATLIPAPLPLARRGAGPSAGRRGTGRPARARTGA